MALIDFYSLFVSLLPIRDYRTMKVSDLNIKVNIIFLVEK